MRWAEIKAATSEQAADLVANILIEEGCGGVAITGPSVRASGGAELPADESGPAETLLTGYLPVDDRLEARLQSARDRIRLLPETGVDIGTGEITIKPVEDADWASAWRSYFKPVEVGNIFVKPSWEDLETTPGQVVVEINPGMAFGTGNHPTTQLCLLALQKFIHGGERVLDVGTGSGVLSIAAAKLGAAQVTATEADPVAAEAARENVHGNGVDANVCIVESQSPASATGEFDLVLANITADAIIGLAAELAHALAPGGFLVASGITGERAQEVGRFLARAGLEIVDKTDDDGWVALALRRVSERDSPARSEGGNR